MCPSSDPTICRENPASPQPLRGVYSDTTQLNSTSSCRHVHSLNCHLSMNVVTQLTQFVGREVINKKHD